MKKRTLLLLVLASIIYSCSSDKTTESEDLTARVNKFMVGATVQDSARADMLSVCQLVELKIKRK